MAFRFKTIGGLLLIAVSGGATALVFQRPTTSSIISQENPVAESAGGAARGRIVPLVVDEQAPLAFVPAAAPAASDGWAPRNRLRSLPTIRASAEAEPAAPEMSEAFPRSDELAATPPAGLAHAEPSTATAELVPLNEAEAFAPIPPPIVAAKPVIAEPVRHKIVDGDSLPQLAEKYLGDETRAAEIYEQNREQLPSPDLLPLGVEITIRP